MDGVALVTGASRGVGRGIAQALGEAGATVYLSGRTAADLERTIVHLGFFAARKYLGNAAHGLTVISLWPGLVRTERVLESAAFLDVDGALPRPLTLDEV